MSVAIDDREAATAESGSRLMPPRDAPDVIVRTPPTALLDLHRLATLREVARCGSYSAAAESLHFTPSAVSQQMAGLARELGSVLFERTPRGMRLTEVAEMLVMHVDIVFARLNDAQGDLDAVAGGRRGRLRVGSFPSATVGFVAEAFGTVQARFPQVELSFSDGGAEENLARLRDRELDLVVVYDFDHRASPVASIGAHRLEPDVDHQDLFDDALSLLLPADHPLAARSGIAIEDLAGERILCCPHGGSPWEGELRERCRQAGFDPILDSRYRTVDSAALHAIVATGRGVTLVPELALPPVRSEIVTRRLIDGPVRHVRIVTLAGVPISTPGRAMVELLHEAAAGRRVAPPMLLPLAGSDYGG